jgi:LysB family phage lysis regulatory protein
MIGLRQFGLAVTVAGALGLLFWGQHHRLNAEKNKSALAADRLQVLQQRNDRQAATIVQLGGEVQSERAAQTTLRNTQNQLRQNLADSLNQIQELEHENTELRDWSSQPLPAAARRLRERPAITGAAGYSQWLSGRRALPTTAGEASR